MFQNPQVPLATEDDTQPVADSLVPVTPSTECTPELDLQEPNEIKSDINLSLADIGFINININTDRLSPNEGVTPVGVTPVNAPEISLQLSEDHFGTSIPRSHQCVEDEGLVADLGSYDIIEDNVALGEPSLSNGHLLDSEDTSNPLYAEKLSRIINRRSRMFSFAPNELTKPDPAEEYSQLLEVSDSHSETVSSIMMEQDLQPTTPGTSSGNRWSAFRLPFTQSTQSLSVSDRAIWIVEGGKGYIYWCKTKTSQISWQYVGGVSAQQVSTSYNGKTVLVVSKEHQLFTREGISSDRCGGKSWLKLHDGENTLLIDLRDNCDYSVLHRNNLY